MPQLHVDARMHDQDAAPGTPLLRAMREQLGPTGTKFGRGGTVRRLRGCLAGVRAQPFEADEWLALQAWLMPRAAHMPWEGVALRP